LEARCQLGAWGRPFLSSAVRKLPSSSSCRKVKCTGYPTPGSTEYQEMRYSVWRVHSDSHHSYLVGPGNQQHLGAWVLRVGSSLDKDGLHGHRTIREVLHTVVLQGAVGRHSETLPDPAYGGRGQGQGIPLEMAVDTQGCLLLLSCVLQVHAAGEAQLVLSQA
jgi:hypothetical protein